MNLVLDDAEEVYIEKSGKETKARQDLGTYNPQRQLWPSGRHLSSSVGHWWDNKTRLMNRSNSIKRRQHHSNWSYFRIGCWSVFGMDRIEKEEMEGDGISTRGRGQRQGWYWPGLGGRYERWVRCICTTCLNPKKIKYERTERLYWCLITWLPVLSRKDPVIPVTTYPRNIGEGYHFDPNIGVYSIGPWLQ